METQQRPNTTPTVFQHEIKDYPDDNIPVRTLTSDAVQHTAHHAMPWSGFNADEVARYNVSVRLNDYYLEALRCISKQQGISQQKFIAQIVLPAIDDALMKLEQ